MSKKFTVAILGSTGYVGLELVKILSKHPNVEIVFLGSENSPDTLLQNAYNLLSENGIFLLILPNAINYDITIDKSEGLKKLNGGSEQIEWHLTHNSWNDMLKSIGFNIFTYRLPDEQWGFVWILKK